MQVCGAGLWESSDLEQRAGAVGAAHLNLPALSAASDDADVQLKPDEFED